MSDAPAQVDPHAFVESLTLRRFYAIFENSGQVAQSVEQRTENPRVGGSIPSLATTLTLKFLPTLPLAFMV